MPRQQTGKVQNKFIRGLITETTALSFPEDACTETFNCIFNETGRVSRRLGFDLEDNHVLNSAVSSDANEVFAEYVWKGVSSLGGTSFVVVQQGSTIRFYDISNTVDVTPNLKSFTINLDNHVATASSRDPAEFPCQFATGLGYLLIANVACEPLYVTYSPAGDTITTTEIVLQHRDTIGLSDGLDLTERITSTVADLKTNNPEHYYNLLNQSWHTADALAQWDSARTDVPSNADYVALFRASATDSFDNDRVLQGSPGNRPAAKGHFILTAWDPDRTAAMVADGFTGATISASETIISRSFGSIIGNPTANGPAAFDGTLAQSHANGARNTSLTSMWLGKTYTTSFAMSKVVVYGSNDQGFENGANNSVTIDFYGKQGTAPSSGTDGTLIGTTTFTDTSNESAGRTITSTDLVTFYDHVWVNIICNSGSPGCTEIQFYAVTDDPDQAYTIERPSSVEFFAGRAWWAGLQTTTRGSNIYFSQICEKADQFGQCYQKNDPTTEDFTDLLPDDGGIIKIPEIATVTRLFAYQNSLLVFATNGIWQISGSSGASFLATDYVIKRLSDISCDAPHSFVSVRGIPVWWAEDGIFTVKFDANYGSFEVTSLTDHTIQSFILDIPVVNRKYVKGCYDVDANIVYWLYNSDEVISSADLYDYNAVLCMNSLSGAFFPWTIGEGDIVIRGHAYITSPEGTTGHRTKFVATIDAGGGTEYIVWVEPANTTYKDWSLYASDHGSQEDEIDYESYFITGYMIEGTPVKFFGSTYAFIYFEQEPCSSCFVQGLWDWSNSGDSGKWSTSQQAYNAFLEHRVSNHRRLKIRGKGKALQLKFTSETGKPFTIIGWILRNSANADV